jgi:hypothetical protein
VENAHDIAAAQAPLQQKTRHPIRELIQLSVSCDPALSLPKSRMLRVNPGNLAELES